MQFNSSHRVAVTHDFCATNPMASGKDEAVKLMTINRREMITGTAALLGSTHLSLAMGTFQREKVSVNSADTNLAEKPKNLLCSTFTPELLSRSLIAASD